ncbi:DNA/RNA-binding protein [Trichinella spiralis]|uniref:DNA/RNA-binding protein n=1 Tax=Trichinella spiralis TaxID=6334 RepID=A0ABR3KT60_TRISP
MAKKVKMDMDDEERMRDIIMKQAERARERLKESGELEEEASYSELKKSDDQKIEFKLPKMVPVKDKLKPLEILSNAARSSTDRKFDKPSTSKCVTRPKSALDEIKEAEEMYKEKKNRTRCWLHPGVVTNVKEERFACLQLLSDQDTTVTVEQKHLETVIPALNRTVLIVNGAYRGQKATLESDDCSKMSNTKISANGMGKFVGHSSALRPLFANKKKMHVIFDNFNSSAKSILTCY